MFFLNPLTRLKHLRLRCHACGHTRVEQWIEGVPNQYKNGGLLNIRCPMCRRVRIHKIVQVG